MGAFHLTKNSATVFLVIPIFRNFRTTSRGRPKIPKRNSGKFPLHSLRYLEFPGYLVEWKATLFGYSGIFPRKFLYHSLLFQKFQNLLSKRKRPSSPTKKFAISKGAWCIITVLFLCSSSTGRPHSVRVVC